MTISSHTISMTTCTEHIWPPPPSPSPSLSPQGEESASTSSTIPAEEWTPSLFFYDKHTHTHIHRHIKIIHTHSAVCRPFIRLHIVKISTKYYCQLLVSQVRETHLRRQNAQVKIASLPSIPVSPLRSFGCVSLLKSDILVLRQC